MNAAATQPAPVKTTAFTFKRGTLALHVSVGADAVCAYLHHPRKAGSPMLAYARCELHRARVDLPQDSNDPPCLWLASAAFNLRPAEAKTLQQALHPTPTQPAAAAAP